jgi:hypothetical protein
MPLKLTLSDLNEAPEAIRSLYRQRSDAGGYILDVEGGVVAKTVHDEFRQNNIALRKQLEAVNPDEVNRLRARVSELEGDEATTSKRKATEFDAQVAALTKDRDGLRQRLESVLIDQQVTKAATELGAHPAALDDIAMRLRASFRLGEDNQPHAVDSQGNKVYGEDGNPLGISGAVRQLTKQAPHLFKPSNGGGASRQSAGGGRSTAAGNPWDKKSWNVTEQMKITKADAGEAQRLQAVAVSEG